MRPIRTVLFDLDGTLIDSIRLIIDSFHHTFAAFGLEARSDEEWLAGVGTPLSIQFAPWARGESDLAAMIAAYREYNFTHHDTHVRVYPEVVSTVRALHAGGIKIGIVTSKSRNGTRRGIALCGIEDAVTAMVCADEVTNHKPHREPVDRCVALLDADPAETIFVGDSVHDMQAGRAAEVRTGAALWGPFARAHLEASAPDHWLSSPTDVARLVLG